MGTIDRQKVAQAAEHATHSNTVITEVIDKDEDANLSISDRFWAAMAYFFVGGACYFAIWLWLLMQESRFHAAAAAWYLDWKMPFAATLLTAALGFIVPQRTLRWFGELMSWH